ncbi:5709_t:CDS:2 [Acaulospora morrowiae]|uniref:5709_t:CDS:1 n=1 Tax=Acaulospora morrowiae TaxID=94023 RepID=A0A9N9CL03_9GLOM|nr:5709_t:CDS:2 [Acaulospora morrowiae]
MLHPALYTKNFTILIFLYASDGDHLRYYTLSYTTESFASHSKTSLYMIIQFDSNDTGIIKGYLTGKSQNLIDHIENIAGRGPSLSSSVKNSSHLNARGLNSPNFVKNTYHNVENKYHMICRIDYDEKLTYVRLIDNEVLKLPNILSPIYIYSERMRTYALYTVRGVFISYASEGNYNSSGLVESPTSIVYSPFNGIYREENNGELTLVGYITRENYPLLYGFSCPECDLLFRYTFESAYWNRPYGCTFPECNRYFQMINNKNRHERICHRKGGRPKDPVWEDFDIGISDSKGHYKANCKFCTKAKWQRGRPAIMMAHLALHCKGNIPDNIRHKWLVTLAKKTEKNININDDYNDDVTFKKAKKEATYQITKDRINEINFTNQLQHYDNLTLTLDGWSSPSNNSLYNFFITTPDRKEYLHSIVDFLLFKQTGQFITEEIAKVVDSIGSQQFIACVTDAGSNIRVAREITTQNYSHILNMKCIVHAINLIATDLVQVPQIKKNIKKANDVIEYFKLSHRAGSLFRNIINTMKIKGGGLETYVKTRWCSFYNTAISIV